jgi:probable DNA repair protein
MSIPFIKSLNGSCTVITANKRLSAFIKNQYDLSQKQSGLNAWPSLDCLPLMNWVERINHNLPDSAQLLSDFQAILIWEQIIKRSLAEKENVALINQWATAQSANEAWKLILEWQIPLPKLSHDRNDDVSFFYQGAKQFAQWCHQHQHKNYLQLIEDIIPQFTHRKIKLPAHIVFAGFEQFSPLLKKLQHTLMQYCEVHELSFAVSNEAIHQIELMDQEQEICAMAAWSRQRIAENNNVRVACVIPEIHSIRNKVEHIFAKEFNFNFATKDLKDLPFNISLGQPLSELPLIKAAFEILLLQKQTIETHKFVELLHSPFVAGSQTEQLLRAQLSRQFYQITASKHTQTSITKVVSEGCCAILQENLQKLFKLTNPSAKSLREWASLFIQQLGVMGWPGERILSSDEFQQWKRWQELMQEFAHLAKFSEVAVCDVDDALHVLRQLANQTIFQSETKTKPIQILGVLEAFGHNFDYLWVMSCNEQLWPSASTANPFIPLELQSQLKIPKSNAEVEFQFAKNIFAQFAKTAKNTIYSYSAKDRDIHLRPCVFIKNIPRIALSQLNIKLEKAQDNLKLEQIHDHIGSPLLEMQFIKGGSDIVKNQSWCAFRAYAMNRLNIKPTLTLGNGFSAIEKGNVVHKILEWVWTQLKDHATLCSYSESELQLLINKIIKQVLADQKYLHNLFLNNHLIEIERQRLQILISNWLNFEKTRQPFFVSAHEKQIKTSLGGLPLSLRIDREDTLDNGLRLIIDYKTGEVSVGDWFEERPNAPQLPLYCILDKDVDAIAFAQVKNSKIQFKGLSAIPIEIDGINAIDQQKVADHLKNWSQFQAYQQQILLQLIENFKAGHAEINPKDNNVCVNCHLQRLCRKHEAANDN